ncbi:MAG: hypothetical protein FLDDKLPJ_03036 [Phycisphaerae bacterium]|nr:hypothetical protein [Phycisphaerae bacterium]
MNASLPLTWLRNVKDKRVQLGVETVFPTEFTSGFKTVARRLGWLNSLAEFARAKAARLGFATAS